MYHLWPSLWPWWQRQLLWPAAGHTQRGGESQSTCRQSCTYAGYPPTHPPSPFFLRRELCCPRRYVELSLALRPLSWGSLVAANVACVDARDGADMVHCCAYQDARAYCSSRCATQAPNLVPRIRARRQQARGPSMVHEFVRAPSIFIVGLHARGYMRFCI
jgi:hypothetical protein